MIIPPRLQAFSRKTFPNIPSDRLITHSPAGQSPDLTPPVAAPSRKDFRDFDAGHLAGEAAAAFTAAAVGAGCGRRDGRFVAVDVLAVDVVGTGDPCAALVAAGVALLEAVDFELGSEGVEEAHCECVVVVVIAG